MAIGNKFLDTNYRPAGVAASSKKSDLDIPYYAGKVIKCPVKFTDDMLEFLESSDFMDLELRPTQKIIIEDLFYTNHPDGSPKYREAVVISGMRSGKSSVASFVCAGMLHRLLQYDDPAAHFGQMSGYQLTAQFIATSEEQSKQTAYAAFESILMGNKWWKKYIGYVQEREIADNKKTSYYRPLSHSIWFRERNLIVRSLHSNSNSIAGMTSFLVIFDELSRYKVSVNEIQGESEASTAQAVYNTAQRSAASLSPYSRVMTVTSPMYETDYGMQLFYQAGTVNVGEYRQEIDFLRRKHRPKNGTNSNIIAYHRSTFEFAPCITNKFGIKTGVDPNDFITYKNTQPLAYKRDFLAIPPGAVNPYMEYPERIELCVVNKTDDFLFTDKIIDDVVIKDGVSEIRKYITKIMHTVKADKLHRYFVCADQGEKSDAFVISMGHIEEYEENAGNSFKYKIIIDFIEAWVPSRVEKVTVSFPNVSEIIEQLAEKFNVLYVAFDQWQSSESKQRLFAKGIKTIEMKANLEMYDEFKKLLYTGYVVIPEDDDLMTELRQLELVGGKKVDHPSNGCFTGDTKIKLLDGTTPSFEELCERYPSPNEEFWVYSTDADGTLIPAKAKNPRVTKEVSKLCVIELDNGEIIKCTPDHLIRLKSGEYVPAINLKVDASLMPCYTKDTLYKYHKGGAGKYPSIFNGRKWVKVHTWVSSYLGFGVRDNNEVIHHININTRDNRPENLVRLTRSEHAQRHMQINSKAHTPEAMAKRIASFKRNYYGSPERMTARSDHAKKAFTSEVKDKLLKAGVEYRATHELPAAFLAHCYTAKGKNNARANIKKIPLSVLKKNGKTLNSVYWKSNEGKKKRLEIGNSTINAALKIRMSREDVKFIAKLTGIIEDKYLISYAQIKKLAGGSNPAWKRRKPYLNFYSNLRSLFGKPLSDILNLVKVNEGSLIAALKDQGLYEEFKLYNHKVKSVKVITLDTPVKVYDLTVPRYENFALDSEVIVHNSKDRSDSVCRTVIACLRDYLDLASKGETILPKSVYMPTARSIAQAQQEYLNEMRFSSHSAMSSGSAIFPSSKDGMTVTRNIPVSKHGR